MWPNPQEIAYWSHLLKSLTENSFFVQYNFLGDTSL